MHLRIYNLVKYLEFFNLEKISIINLLIIYFCISNINISFNKIEFDKFQLWYSHSI